MSRVLSSIQTLSTNARYFSISASSASPTAAEVQSINQTIQDACVQLGWTQEYAASLSTASYSMMSTNAYDFAESTHEHHIKLYCDSSYHLHFEAGIGSTSVTALSGTTYTSGENYFNSRGSYEMQWGNPNAQSTIWIFSDGSNYLHIVPVIEGYEFNDAITGGDYRLLWSQYKKEYGEHIRTGYLHNGFYTNSRNFFRGNGNLDGDHTISLNGTDYNTVNGENAIPQFLVTNYPRLTSTPTDGSDDGWVEDINDDNPLIAATINGNLSEHYSTRLGMGWLGYIGHVSTTASYSLEYTFFWGHDGWMTNESLSVDKPVGEESVNSAATTGNQLFNCENNPQKNSVYDYCQEYNPFDRARPRTQVNAFEPILGIGQFQPSAAISNSYGSEFGGFYLLGRNFGWKLIGPHENGKYAFLDTFNFPVDSEGFYDPNGTDTEFWYIPFAYQDKAANGARTGIIVPK